MSLTIKQIGIIAAAVVLVGVGTGVGEYYWHQHQAKVDLHQADQHAADANVAAIQWEKDHNDTVAVDAEAPAKDRTIASLKAQLAALKHPTQVPGQAAVTPPPETPIEHKQDQIIAAEDDRLALAQKQIAARDKELADAHVQVKELQLEVGSLRATIAATPGPRNWGAGYVRDTNGAQGVTVVRSFGPLEISADVVQGAVNGGQRNIEARGRVTWRF